MIGEVKMRARGYWKPNMNNLKGKKGRQILLQLRNMQSPSTEKLENEAKKCMDRILAQRRDGEITRK